MVIRILVALLTALPIVLGSAAAPAAGAAPLQVFVEPSAHLSPVLSLIRSAHHSIDLEVYLLTNRSVANALGQAQRNGVKVRVLLEERPYGATRYAQLGHQLMQEAGVSVRWANEGAFRFTHEKAMVIDGRVAGIFTFNLSSSGLYRNREFGVIDNSSADARTLTAIFDADWKRRAMHLRSTRLAVSPYNARHDFQTLIDGARHTLDLYAEEVDDASIEAHLIDAQRHHVRVRLITSAESAGVDTLRHGGVAVTIMPSPYVHAKAIVADGTKLFIGSENISATSLDQNREAGIVLSDRGLAGVVEETFASDWRRNAGPSSSSPPPSSSGSLQVHVTAAPSNVRRGQLLTITASTGPGASCTIRVTYPDGYVSRASSLSGSRTADSAGTVTWSWHVGSTASGTAHADVRCDLNGKSATGGATFQIQ